MYVHVMEYFIHLTHLDLATKLQTYEVEISSPGNAFPATQDPS